MKGRAVGLAVLLLLVVGCGGDEGDPEAFCLAAKDQSDLDAVFDTFDRADVEGAAVKFETALAAYTTLREDAPPEIRDDLDVMIEFVRDFSESLRSTDPNDPTGTTATALEFEERFEQVNRSTAALEAYVAQECVTALSNS